MAHAQVTAEPQVAVPSRPRSARAGVGDRDASLTEVAVGPLGVAGLVPAADGAGGDVVVFSPDGTTVSATPLDDLAPSPMTVVGLHVTADAVFVRGHERSAVDDDPTTIAPQVVLVGTP